MGWGADDIARTVRLNKYHHPTHTSILSREHLGNNGKNEFEYGADGKPKKRQIDVWQGAFKKSGMSATQAKRLRWRLDKSLKNMCCCN